ncbi:MAG: hypothetical protein RIQ89_1583 [Bacteroidota bacterium]
MIKFNICILFLLLAASSLTAQDDSLPKRRYTPAIGLGRGLVYFIGDIGHKRYDSPINTHGAWQLELEAYKMGKLSLNLFLINGTSNGTDDYSGYKINYKSKFVTEGLSLRYDFDSQHQTNTIVPFIGAGVGFIVHSTKVDMKDAEGRQYNYWTDGTIRSMAQQDPAASTATVIYRDYRYETDVTTLDSIGKFNKSSLTIPISIGVKMKLSSRIDILFNGTMHLVQSDFFDALSAKENKSWVPVNDANDRLFLTTATCRFRIGAPRDTPKPKKYKSIDYKDIDFEALAREDADADGVSDFIDHSNEDSIKASVDAKGVAIDSDGDGVPDYKDAEPATLPGSLVTLDGKTFTDEMLAEKAKRDSMAEGNVVLKEYLKVVDKLKSPTGNKSKPVGIPLDFIQFDKDANGVIAPKEITEAIDTFLDGKLNLSTRKFYELIDFYFQQ